MGKTLQLIVTFDPQSGQVGVQGPIDHAFWCVGALEEAKRIVQRRANQRDDVRANGKRPDLIIAPADAVPPFRS